MATLSGSLYSSCALTLVIAAALHAIPAQAADGMPEVQQQGDISYVTGGIGDEERSALEGMQQGYNLRITSTDDTGHFSGDDTRIVVSDLKQHGLLDVTGGPFFYAILPEGRYSVEGFSDGQSKKQAITIASGKPVDVHFSWPETITDTTHHLGE